MTFVRSAVAAVLLILSSTSHAFIRPSLNAAHVAKASTTQLNMFEFLKEGKKKLVKSLAGDYDEVAVRARLNGLINDNPVLMLSFTT